MRCGRGGRIAAEGALPPDGNAGGRAAQVRSPLYTHARLSGGFFSAVVVGMLLVNCVFSLTVVLIARAQGVETAVITGSEAVRYLSYLLYQLLYLGALAAVVFIYKEKPRAFGYRKTSWKYFLIALALQFGLLFSLDRANVYFIDLLGMLGYKSSSGGASSLPSLAGGGIVGVLVVVAVLPAVLEESLFRGVMLEGMKALGTAAACLLGGLCFSLFHQSPDQTVYQFICGAAFTLLALRADSLLPAVAAHFCNNALIVFNEKFGFLNHVSAGGEIAIYVLSALCLVGSLAWLIFFDKRGKRETAGAARRVRKTRPARHRRVRCDVDLYLCRGGAVMQKVRIVCIGRLKEKFSCRRLRRVLQAAFAVCGRRHRRTSRAAHARGGGGGHPAPPARVRRCACRGGEGALQRGACR